MRWMLTLSALLLSQSAFARDALSCKHSANGETRSIYMGLLGQGILVCQSPEGADTDAPAIRRRYCAGGAFFLQQSGQVNGDRVVSGATSVSALGNMHEGVGVELAFVERGSRITGVLKLTRGDLADNVNFPVRLEMDCQRR